MKLTQTQLRKIIKEEAKRLMSEAPVASALAHAEKKWDAMSNFLPPEIQALSNIREQFVEQFASDIDEKGRRGSHDDAVYALLTVLAGRCK